MIRSSNVVVAFAFAFAVVVVAVVVMEVITSSSSSSDKKMQAVFHFLFDYLRLASFAPLPLCSMNLIDISHHHGCVKQKGKKH